MLVAVVEEEGEPREVASKGPDLGCAEASQRLAGGANVVLCVLVVQQLLDEGVLVGVLERSGEPRQSPTTNLCESRSLLECQLPGVFEIGEVQPTIHIPKEGSGLVGVPNQCRVGGYVPAEVGEVRGGEPAHPLADQEAVIDGL